MALMRFAVLTSPPACVIGIKFVIHEPGFIAIMFAATRPSMFFATVYIWQMCIRDRVDVFFITLNKADKDYSPTTMYNDYSINESLFHWQSQSTTSDTASTGQRYINHRQRGSKVVLFVREFKQDSIGAAPYTCCLLYTSRCV